MSASDDPLLDRVRQGDAQALAEFLTANRASLLAYINRQLGPALRAKVEPEDILQEVSVGAVRSLPAVDLTSQEPFGWLCQIAQHRIVDAHRRYFGSQKRAAGREVGLQRDVGDGRGNLIDMIVASITSPSQAFSRDQRQMCLEDAIAQLPEQSREALRLRYVEGLPSKEVADRLGKSDGAIRVLLSRSLAQLRVALDSTSA
ncbi:MAG: sigma-70 family RNA polymerase sigma factor [Pirellulales bacterium]